MSIQRGLFRVTAVISVLLFVAGIGIAAFLWNDERQAWARAIAPPPGKAAVYIAGLGIRMGFSPSTSREEMMKHLADTEEMGFEDLGEKAKAAYPDTYNQLSDVELGKRIVAKNPDVVKDLRPMGGIPGGERRRSRCYLRLSWGHQERGRSALHSSGTDSSDREARATARAERRSRRPPRQ